MADIEGVNLKITADGSQAQKEIEKVSNATNKLGGAKIKSSVDVDFTTVAKNLSDLGKKFETGFKTILKGITAGVTAVGGAISYITKQSLAIGGGFEAQMTSVKVISGATGEELDALTKKAREMGANLPITAKDAAQAMELLAQRGTKAKDILASVSDVASLAISQQVDMAAAAEMLGTTITNFGMKFEDASKITNIFNNASNQSALNMSKLSAAMKYVGPAAGAMNIPLEKAVAAMEAAANAGLTGEMIGTGLAMILTKLSTSSNILGVNTRNLDGTMRDLSEIFSDLAQKGMDVGQANVIFGQRAGKTAIALAKNSASLVENEKNLQKWGATQNAVNEKMKTWPNVWNAFQSAVEELHIEIFEQIKTQSKEAINSVASLTRTFSEWINETQIAGQTLNSFLQGLGFRIPANSDFKKLLSSFDVQGFLKKIQNFGAGIKGIAESIANFYNLIKTPLKFLIEHLSTFAALSFWGWIIGKGMQVPAQIISLASAFMTLYKNLQLLTGLNFASLLSFLTNPIVAGVVAVGAVAGTIMYDNYTEEQIKKLQEEKERIKQEVEKLNNDALFEVSWNVFTGFEEIPESYAKAADDMKALLDETIGSRQDKFKEKIAEAAQEINKTLDKTKQEFTGTADDVTEAMAGKFTKALQGDINTFETLSAYELEVLKQLTQMGVKAGQAQGSVSTLFDIYEKRLKKVVSSETVSATKNEFAVLTSELQSGLNEIFNGINSEVEKSRKLLGDKDLNFIIDVSTTKAQTKIEELAKTISTKFGVSEEITNRALLNQLQEWGSKGVTFAQSLASNMDGATSELDNFMAKAQDMVDYLNVSPQKFLPALNKLTSGIQRIDPITGRVTKDFKEAFNALKQWNSLTFDKLSQRIQSLRKAVEGGFLDKKALEREYKNALSQVSLQVKTELEPMRSSFRSQRDYEAVFASNVYDKMFELGGDIFSEQLKKNFDGQTGASMGHSLAVMLERELSGQNKSVFKVNGTEQKISSINNENNSVLQQMAQGFNNIATKIENINIQQPSQPQVQVRDYSAVIAQIVSEIKTLTNAVNSVESVVRSQPQQQNLEQVLISLKQSSDNNVNALNQLQNSLNSLNNNSSGNVDLTPLISQIQTLTGTASQITSAVNSVENALKSSSQGNTFNIEVNQEGFTIQKKSDADSLARSTVSAIRSGIGNGGL